MKQTKIFFITGTDTGVGKTVATAVLALLMRQQGFRVGVLKPVQCAGHDAAWLKKILNLPQSLRTINPIYAPEALSAHLALQRSKKRFDINKVKASLEKIKKDCDIVLIEGAGGLLVPLTDRYTNADLVKELQAKLIIVSRLGLGTINHTLLTLEVARLRKLNIAGILFSNTKKSRPTLPELTNPREIARLSKVQVLGTIPFLTNLTAREIVKKCAHLKLL